MKFQKGFMAPLLMLIAAVALFGGAYFQHAQNLISTYPHVQSRVSNLELPTNNDPAFSSSTYQKTSSMPVSQKEMTVVYQYSDNPCGTLITQYSEVGSVSVGRGPVYALALDQCKTTNSSYMPDDYSFRTYACENKLVNNQIQGRATFAFQCSMPDERTK